MEKQRIVEYDYLKGILIWLVIWGHLIKYVDIAPNNPVFVWIYSFHMPLFMFLCGYFSQNQYKMNFIPFIKKQIHHLIIPNIIWATVVLSIFIPIGIYPHTFNWNGKNILFLYTDLWFLWATLFCSLFYFVCCRIQYKYRYITALSIFVFLFLVLIYYPPHFLQKLSLPFFFTMLPYMFPAFIMGSLYHCCKVKKMKHIFPIILCTSSIAYISIMAYTFYNGLSIQQVRIPLRTIMYMSGCIFHFYLFLFFIKKSISVLGIVKLDIIGQNTLGIYILQHVAYYWLPKAQTDSIRNSVAIFIISLFFTYLLFLCVERINRWKYHKLLLG